MYELMLDKLPVFCCLLTLYIVQIQFLHKHVKQAALNFRILKITLVWLWSFPPLLLHHLWLYGTLIEGHEP